MKTAIVHEWLTARAGSELCFERIAGLWPTADLFALSKDPSVSFDFGGRPVATTALDRVARSQAGRAASLPLMAPAFRTLRPREPYDLVVSSTHAYNRAFAHPDAVHLSYTYTPVRYVWYPETDTRGAGSALAPARRILKTLDLKLARNTTAFAGISTTVAKRIEAVYERHAEVVFPFADTDFFDVGAPDRHLPSRISSWSDGFVLSVGRLIPYKRHDLAIRVAGALGLPAVVAGAGPDLERLRAVDAETAGTTVFVEGPSRETIRALYQAATITVFPPDEDFGIVPVESLACGTPVLALDSGGALDTVPTDVGVRSPSQDLPDMVDSAEKLLANLPASSTCRDWSLNFSPDTFDARFRAWVERWTN